MKTSLKITIAMGVMAVFPMLMSAESVECQSITANTKAVALASPRGGPLVNFTGSGGLLDPVPLLETQITVPGPPGRVNCVTLTFSAQADPGDNYGVYQASIDSVPMSGHGTLSEYGISTPVVFDAVNQATFLPTDPNRFFNPATSRMVSYTFFAPVTPGVHTIVVRVAGCCSQSPGGVSPVFVRAATMVATW